jgi:hypothetical protein
MGKKIVFLSGPMRGVPRDQGLAWRQEATRLLQHHFKVLHSYRGREEKETFPDPRLAVIRDKNDIVRASAVLVNDTFPNAPMIGTSMEVLWANLHHKVIIVFGDAHRGNYFLDFHCHARVPTLQSACKLLNRMFTE